MTSGEDARMMGTPEGRKSPEELRLEYERREKSLKERIIDKTIIRKFKFGVKKVCGKRIWDRIGEWAEYDSQEDLGFRFGMPRSDVTKGMDYGALSLENLIIILTELRREFEHLPTMPNREDRVVAGYEEGVAWVCSAVLGRDEERRIERSELFSVCALLSDPEYLAADAAGELDDGVWERVLERTRRKAANWLGLGEGSGDRLPYQSAPEFDELRKKWAEAVTLCRLAIPFRWVGVI